MSVESFLTKPKTIIWQKYSKEITKITFVFSTTGGATMQDLLENFALPNSV